MSSAISRVAPACALSGCLLAAAAHAGSPYAAVPAADPKAPVPPTQYQSSAAYRPLAAEPATPDQAWREQNRIVAAAPGHDHAMHGHAGHAMPQAAPADPHAGHTMPAAADPHAGHTMPVPAPAPAQADPHAGHAMHHAAPAPAPAPAAPAHQHEGHH